MSQLLSIHPVDPQQRLVKQAVTIIQADGLVVYPTDSCYAFGCRIGARQAIRMLQRIRQTGRNHNFTLVCCDLSEIASYARLENWSYRLLKAHTPGPYTFVLRATRDVPRKLQNPRRKTIGIRVPDHPVTAALLAGLGEPLISSTLRLPGDELPMVDPYEIMDRLRNEVELVIDGGSCGIEPTTVIDLTDDYPVVLREGKGEIQSFI